MIALIFWVDSLSSFSCAAKPVIQMHSLESLSVLLEEDTFLLAFLQSFVDFRNGQRQGVGDVSPACGSLQVAPILHPPFVIPQEGIIDLDSPDPDQSFRRERDTTHLNFTANLLRVAHAFLPLLVDDDYLPCLFLRPCGAV